MTAMERGASATKDKGGDDSEEGASDDASQLSADQLPRSSRSTTPSKSEIFDLVSNHRRRYTIHFCKEQNGPVELANLAEHVAARELGKSVDELTSDERKRVYTSLQQTHLPRLERAGMITNDNGTIELTEQIAELEIYLDIVPKRSVPWGVYYLGLSAVSTLVLGLVYFEVVPPEFLSHLGWATIILSLFAISSVVHVFHNHKYRLDRIDQPADEHV